MHETSTGPERGQEPDVIREFAAAADAWRAWCQGAQTSPGEDAPIAVVLLAAFAEPPRFAERFTGDMVSDLLGVVQGTVARWRSNTDGPEAIEGWELRQLDRRLDAALELCRRALAAGGGR